MTDNFFQYGILDYILITILGLVLIMIISLWISLGIYILSLGILFVQRPCVDGNRTVNLEGFVCEEKENDST